MPLEHYSLSVGIDHYPGLTSLGGAEEDARAFHGWVKTAGAVPNANARLIVSADFPAAATVADARPVSQQIWDFFERLRAAANANNQNDLGLVAGRRLYMFFSGHGFSPTLDTSGVLMANAELDTPHNLSAKAWADRFYENGLFEEILLFQDACREQVSDVDLTPPYFKRSPTSGAGLRKRFYAFAAKSPQLSLEKPIGGTTHGVFSATLMAGLAGGARDPATGEITAAKLKAYLVSNMAARLDAAELANDEISQRPEVFDLDPFVIVPAPAAPGAGPEHFPVKVALPPPGPGADILNTNRQIVTSTPAGVLVWDTQLALGLYKLVAPGVPSHVFKVTGALGPDGQPEAIHVP